jgi:demethylmenaquinone methyltransferase/2-methoxy-6-polyprenyl-1,4-benzoquinol methylase
MEPRALFTGVARRYDRPAEALSLGGYGRWRRGLVRAMGVRRDAVVLDVATGTGLIARDVWRRYGCRVVGLDLTEAMLRRARGERVAGDARVLPFPDGAFDALTFSYLLRYVDEPAAVLAELRRVVRPRGRIGSVEFGVPRAALTRAGWHAYARGVMPALSRGLGPGWRAVGAFLPDSIEAWARAWPIDRQVAAWRAAGIDDVAVRTMTLGAGVVMTGTVR